MMVAMMGRASLVAATAALALVLVPGLASAATITPNILTDEDTTNGNCSLREAVTLASGDHGGSYNGCVAADEDDDEIVLQSGSTYTLSIPGGSEDLNATGDLDVANESLRIESTGPGRATIDANGGITADRVIEFGHDPGSLVPVGAIDSLVITGGDPGDFVSVGGVFANYAGSVTIEDSRIVDNEASGGAAIRADAGLTINRTTISGNDGGAGGAGAVWVSQGVATISDSTISGNSGDTGGALFVSSPWSATVTNTTISGNDATGNGGAIAAFGTVNLVNATVASNTANSDSNATGDGGGVFVSGGTVNARNSVVADNLDLGGTNTHPDCSGTLTGQGYTLVENQGGATGCTVSGIITGNLSGDPELSPLGDNGGPTHTHSFPAGGPLDNSANPAIPGSAMDACETADQRGFARDSSISRCDIGAYERQPPVLDPIGDKSVQAGQTLAFTATATDSDLGDILTFASPDLPPGATLSPAGAFSWTPTAAQIGSFPGVTINALDGSLADSEDITITVTAVPPPDTGGGGTPTTPKKKCKKGRKLKKGRCVKKKRKKRK
jgi:CSLREA domain-containing protein